VLGGEGGWLRGSGGEALQEAGVLMHSV